MRLLLQGAKLLKDFLEAKRRACAVCGLLGHHLRCSACSKGARVRICGTACLRAHAAGRQCKGLPALHA
jgi:hypothetical protein